MKVGYDSSMIMDSDYPYNTYFEDKQVFVLSNGDYRDKSVNGRYHLDVIDNEF